jgi:carbon monoxide dehydrogenase subunit G
MIHGDPSLYFRKRSDKSMKIAGEYIFDAPQDMVWEALQDPNVLASIMPGCEKLELVGENEYEGALKIKVGPVQGKFQGNVKLEDINPPQSYSMTVDGKGVPGFVKGKGGLKLTGQGEKTLMEYEGDAQVGGRIASVGQRLLDSSAKSIVKQSLEGLNAVMKGRVAAAQEDRAGGGSAEGAAASSSPQVEIKTPSQLGFAANVAQDVASDLIPAKYWPFLIAGGIVLLIIVLYLIFR